MKNRLILLVLTVSFGLFLSSCNSDDNEGETLAPLAGKWNITKIGTTVAGQEFLIDPPQNQSGCDKDYLEIKLDNTLTAGDYNSTDTPCALATKSGIYSRSHNNFTTVIDGTTTTEDIVNLTLTELKLKDSSGAILVFTRN